MKFKILVFILRFFPKKIGHKVIYSFVLHKKLNLNKPQTLNEKIHWLEIYKYGKKEAYLSDKSKVKDYIANLHIADLNIPKTYFIIDDIKNLDKYNFPDKFVLKCNHGSGDVFICTDKEKFNFKNALKALNKLKKKDFSKKYLEYHYSLIKPLIMCEEYLNDEINHRPIDYKFFCFDGYVECVMICSDRGTNNYKDFYDRNWNYLNYSKSELRSKQKINQPKNYKKMIKIASTISKGFEFVRVDLYNINGKIYFGELTFTPAAGLSDTYTDEADVILGSYLKLKKEENRYEK